MFSKSLFSNDWCKDSLTSVQTDVGPNHVPTRLDDLLFVCVLFLSANSSQLCKLNGQSVLNLSLNKLRMCLYRLISVSVLRDLYKDQSFPKW